MGNPLTFKEIIMPHPNPRNEYVTYGRRLQPETHFESKRFKKALSRPPKGPDREGYRGMC